jgi:tetratricopeptide (TPR) repeat protein
VRRVALWVAIAAVVAHVGFVPGLPGWVGTHQVLNYDDRQVIQRARDTGVDDLISGITYYAYKPVYFLSLKIDLLFDDDGAGFGHVVNLLLFAFSAFLLVGVLHGVLRSVWLAGAAGLLFAVHPAHVESVAWLSGRKDVLSLVLVLLAHVVYRRRRERAPEGAAGVSFGAAALLALGGLTKGTVWTWAGVLALDEAIEAHRGGRPGAGKRLLPCVLVALLGIAMDAYIGMRWGPGDVAHGVTTLELMAAMAGVHLAYLGTVLCPVGLTLDHAVSPAGSWASPAAWVGLLLAVGAVVGLAVSLKRGRAALALALGIWILALAPVNNVWPRTTILMADRYLLPAAVGVYLLVAWVLSRAGPAKAGVLAVAAILLGVLAVARTRTFADSATVWDDALAKSPHSALANVQRGIDAAEHGEYRRALEKAERALALAPRAEIELRARLLRCAALLGLGRTEDLLSEAGDAAVACRLLARRGGSHEDPRVLESEAEVFRGQALEAMDDRAGAREAYRRAASLNGESATAHFNLGTVLAQMATLDSSRVEALAHLARARALAPDWLEASLQYAKVLATAGQPEEALKVYRQAEARHGRRPELLFARAEHYLAVGAAEAATADLETLRRQFPNHARAARLVYDLYVADGRRLLEEGRKTGAKEPLAKALGRFTDAQRAEASWPEAWIGEGDVLAEQGRMTQARERYRRALVAQPGAAWIRSLIVRVEVLEAAYQARHAADEGARLAAARAMASALAEVTARIDLGLVPLEAELPLLRKAADLLERAAEPIRGWAAVVLCAGALMAVGDDERAGDLLRDVVRAPVDEQGARELLDAALLLRAGVRDRAALLESALDDYRLLEKRRPDDPAPGLRRLQIELRAALARRSIAAGWVPEKGRVEAARERLWTERLMWSDAPTLEPDEVTATFAALDVLREVDRLKAADDVVEEVGRSVVTFAGAHPEQVDAGLLSAEAEMRRGGWVEALKRLNALGERFPDHPSVLRGQAAVYVNQYMTVQDRMLLEEALQALQRAEKIDPRDPRTALDAAGVRRIAGDVRGAISLAMRARSFENLPGGPASRMLAALHLATGEQALEAGDAASAKKAIEAARRVSPGSAASFVLEGRVLLERERDTAGALIAARRAKELEPANLDAERLLSRIHWQQGQALQLAVFSMREPLDPASKDYAAWQKLDVEGRTKAVADWEAARAKIVLRREEFRARAIQDLESSLREDPGSEHAEKAQKALDALRRNDPDDQRRRMQAATEAWARGKAALDSRRWVDAYTAFEEVLANEPGHERALFHLVQTAYERLLAGALDESLRSHVTNRAFAALQALDQIDAEDRFPLRHFYRGLLNEVLFRRSQREDARQSAIGAFRRYEDSQRVAKEPDATNTARAAHLRDQLERAGPGR